jgi:hypothetical protein
MVVYRGDDSGTTEIFPEALHYAPSPKEVVSRGEQALTEITYEGQYLLAKI